MDLTEQRRIARKHYDQISAGNPREDLPRGWFLKDVQSMSLASLTEILNISDSENDRLKCFETILIWEAYLFEKKAEEYDSSSRNAAISLREWVSKAILPSRAFAETSPYSMDEKPVLTPDTIAKEHALSLQGLLLLSHLQRIAPLSSTDSTISLLTCLASFSDDSDPWSSPPVQEQAQALLENSLERAKMPALLHAVLQERVKPLFAKSKSPAITQQGRKAIDPLPMGATAHSDMDVEAKPWKYRDMYIVTVFQWVLKHSNATSIEANWPLIIPPLLALIDDSSISYKAKGCTHLTIFLKTCPPPLLERTGLGEVFENALMPCLMYLPSLTEERESLQLLRAAYPALLDLSRVRFPDEKQRDAKQKALDRILRYGIFKGYAHASEHVKIAELLVEQLMKLLNEMGIASIKHLKHILPMLAATLAVPFATAYPPLLEASIRALETVMINGWPRITHHRGEILKGLTICWCRIEEEETKSMELRTVQGGIERLVRVLTLVTVKDVDVGAEYQILIDGDDRLRDVLIV